MKLSPLRARRGPVLAALAVAAVLSVTACGSSSSAPSASNAAAAAPAGRSGGSSGTPGSGGSGRHISLTVGYIGTQNIFTGPEGFAYAKGLMLKWLKPYGVTSLKDAGFANGPLLNAALVGGSVDVGLVGDTPALIAKSQGAPTRVINQEELNLSAWVITRKSITSLGQLAGQSVARQQASYMDRYVQGLLQEQGILGKVHLTPMLFAQAIPAFNAGSIPALVVIPSLAPLIKVPYNIVARSQATPDLQGTGVTVASNKALAEDPGLAAAWNAMRVKAIRYAQAHQAAYYAFQARAEQTTPALAKRYFPLSDNPTQPFTAYGLARLRSTLGFLVHTDQAKPFSIAGWRAR